MDEPASTRWVLAVVMSLPGVNVVMQLISKELINPRLYLLSSNMFLPDGHFVRTLKSVPS